MLRVTRWGNSGSFGDRSENACIRAPTQSCSQAFPCRDTPGFIAVSFSAHTVRHGRWRSKSLTHVRLLISRHSSSRLTTESLARCCSCPAPLGCTTHFLLLFRFSCWANRWVYFTKLSRVNPPESGRNRLRARHVEEEAARLGRGECRLFVWANFPVPPHDT